MSCTCTQKYGNKVLYGNTVPAFQPSNHSAGVTVFGEWLCGSMVVQMFPFHFWFKKFPFYLAFYFLPTTTTTTQVVRKVVKKVGQKKLGQEEAKETLMENIWASVKEGSAEGVGWEVVEHEVVKQWVFPEVE